MKNLKIFIAALLVTACAHKAERKPDSAATPVNLETKDLFGPTETHVLKDLVMVETFGKKIKYKVEATLWTDMNKKNLQENVIKSLKAAIRKTFEGSAGEEFIKSLQKNLVAEVIDNFVTTLRVFDILDGDIRVDLHFTPEADSPMDLTAELDSNHLINFRSTKPKLSLQIDKAASRSITDEIARMAPVILQYSEEKNIFVGGAISLNLKLLSTTVDKRLPQTFKNGVQGIVRFRRYFAQNTAPQFNSSCGVLKSDINSNISVTTVDLYQEFNLKELKPKNRNIDIYPGKIVSTAEGAPNQFAILPEDKSHVGQTISMYKLSLDEKSTKNKFNLDRLGYGFENGKARLSANFSMTANERFKLFGLGKEKDEQKMLSACEADINKAVSLESYFPKVVLQ